MTAKGSAMNSVARQALVNYLHENLPKHTQEQQRLFSRMYPSSDQDATIHQIIDGIPEDKLEHAVTQVQRSKMPDQEQDEDARSWTKYPAVTPDEIAKQYRSLAYGYDRNMDDIGFQTPSQLSLILSLMAIEGSDAPILDVGCGSGITGQVFRDHGFTNIHGCDLLTEMLWIAMQKDLFKTLTKCDMHELKSHLPGGFDIVSCLAVLDHSDRPVEVIRQLIDITRPGGMIIFSERDDLAHKYRLHQELDKLDNEGCSVILRATGLPYCTKSKERERLTVGYYIIRIP